MQPQTTPRDTGWIEVVAGCMFSGKTEELIRRLRRAKIAKFNVKIFKPKIDTRYSKSEIVSHDEQSLPSVLVDKSSDILPLIGDAEVVGIDEAQFFDKGITELCIQLADKGKRVVVAGLDMDYRGIPFGPMPELLATAEYITKVHAICVVCGDPATRTQRKGSSTKRVLVGASDSYEARCRKCHYIP